MSILECKALTKRYGGKTALDGVELAIEPGDEVVCPAPYFVEYGSYCGHFGGVLKAIDAKPDEGFRPDFEAMAAAV